MLGKDQLEKLRNDPNHFKIIYADYREKTIQWLSKYHNNFEEIKDVYQDAVLVLFENCKKTDFQLTASIETYLNSICRNQLLSKYRKNSKMHLVNMDNFDPTIDDWFSDNSFNAEKEERLSTIEKAMELFKEQSKKCFDLLSMQYYDKKRMDIIAETMGFSNDKSAKSQASKCRGELRKLVQSSYA